jgi:hypothetical protein
VACSYPIRLRINEAMMQFVVLEFRLREIESRRLLDITFHAEIADHSTIRSNNSMSAVISYGEDGNGYAYSGYWGT